MRHKVSIVIPTWKRPDLLRNCLESLLRQSFTDFEIVLVSNGAGAWADVLAREFRSTLIRLDTNCGFAAAVNAGIAASHSPYVLLLNDDVELEPDWLQCTTSLLDEHADLSFCCGKIYRGRSNVLDNAGDAVAMSGSSWRLGFGRPDEPTFDVPRTLLAVSATAALFRRSVFQEVGPFDEDLFSYLEDIDFSFRAMHMGHRGLYWPRAVARHYAGATSGGPNCAAVFELLTRNQLLLLAKHYPWPLLIRLAPRIKWAQLLWLAVALKKGRLGAWLRGLAGFLRRAPRVAASRHSRSPDGRVRQMAWLRESEAAIFQDHASRPRASQDSFWRVYFWMFPARRPETAMRALPTRPEAVEPKQS